MLCPNLVVTYTYKCVKGNHDAGSDCNDGLDDLGGVDGGLGYSLDDDDGDDGVDSANIGEMTRFGHTLTMGQLLYLTDC